MSDAAVFDDAHQAVVEPARAHSIGASPPVLFYDRGCPYAQRVLALCDYLGCPIELRQSHVGHKPAGVQRYSASGALPLLVHGDLVLTESRVMIEHLAELHRFAEAYPADLGARTLHRHAMALVDNVLGPVLLGRTRADVDGPRFRETLDAIEAATATAPPGPSLHTMHVAPIWLRFRLWQPTGDVTRAIESRPALCRWLDAAVRVGCVARTAPDTATHLEDLATARQAGLLPRDPDEADRQR